MYIYPWPETPVRMGTQVCCTDSKQVETAVINRCRDADDNLTFGMSTDNIQPWTSSFYSRITVTAVYNIDITYIIQKGDWVNMIIIQGRVNQFFQFGEGGGGRAGIRGGGECSCSY